MKVIVFAIATLCGSVGATSAGNDALAAEALEKPTEYVNENGSPNPESCTHENASVRRELYEVSRT